MRWATVMDAVEAPPVLVPDANKDDDDDDDASGCCWSANTPMLTRDDDDDCVALTGVGVTPGPRPYVPPSPPPSVSASSPWSVDLRACKRRLRWAKERFIDRLAPGPALPWEGWSRTPDEDVDDGPPSSPVPDSDGSLKTGM